MNCPFTEKEWDAITLPLPYGDERVCYSALAAKVLRLTEKDVCIALRAHTRTSVLVDLFPNWSVYLGQKDSPRVNAVVSLLRNLELTAEFSTEC